MSSTRFEPEASSAGRQLYEQYGTAEYFVRIPPARLLALMHVKRTKPHLHTEYNCLAEAVPSGSKLVKDIIN
jgi:hypothetical protein